MLPTSTARLFCHLAASSQIKELVKPADCPSLSLSLSLSLSHTHTILSAAAAAEQVKPLLPELAQLGNPSSATDLEETLALQRSRNPNLPPLHRNRRSKSIPSSSLDGQIKHALHSFMQVIGLLSAAPRSGESTSSIESPDEYSFCSGLMLPGLSNEIQQALPLTAYNPDLHIGAQVDVECPVCLQELHKDQEVRHLPFCRHVFHRSCLDGWLEQEQFTCPVCRSSLVPEEVCKKQQQREQEISEELFLWFSSASGSGFQGLWCYS